MVCLAMTVAPENTVHVIGDVNPVLRCSIEDMSSFDLLIWNEYITDPVNGKTVAIGDSGVAPGLEDKYFLDGTNLGIYDAHMSDAGKYECRNTISPLLQMAAELLLLGEHVCVCTGT